MQTSVLTVVASIPILVGWLAVSICQYQSTPRRRRQHAGWAQLAPGLSELDTDLDLVWAAEQERIRRYR